MYASCTKAPLDATLGCVGNNIREWGDGKDVGLQRT